MRNANIVFSDGRMLRFSRNGSPELYIHPCWGYWYNSLLVDSGSNVGILSVHVDDDVAVLSVESNVVTGESDLLADSSCNLFEVNLRLVNANFSKKNNLKY